MATAHRTPSGWTSLGHISSLVLLGVAGRVWQARRQSRGSVGSCSALTLQDDRTGLLTSGSSPPLPHCLGGPLTPPKAAGELVKDKCQDLICCQSHTENTAGSTSLVAELVVVYRLFPAPTCVCICVCTYARVQEFGPH